MQRRPTGGPGERVRRAGVLAEETGKGAAYGISIG